MRPYLGISDWEQYTLGHQQFFPQEALKNIGHGHISYQQIQHFLLPEMLEEYYKFCIVREPLDRFMSAYSFLNRLKTENTASMLNNMKKVLNTKPQTIHYIPQYSFITDNSKQLCMDHIGRYENLGPTLNILRTILKDASFDLPYINISKRKPLYRSKLVNELGHEIDQYYHDDYNIFKYPRI